jgi:dihydrodipicolinate synthase/N-acetylneuraminate lyase
MDLSELTPERLRRSVIAVPPLARDTEGAICAPENRKVIEHIEQGGVDILLYGGNAMFYHLRPSEYAEVLALLRDTADRETAVIPSVGPTYGVMMDQAEVLQDFRFPTAMVLPQRDIADARGIAQGLRAFAAAFDRPIVLYLKFARWLPVETIRSMVDEGMISWIKYAVVRDDPARDNELNELVDAVGGERIISGIGEQPAIVHIRDFGVNGFTSGCVCIAPRRSMEMLGAIHAGEYQRAEEIRSQFEALEHLRNTIHPIAVLQAAVASCGIARTGSVLPLLSDPSDEQLVKITAAAEALLSWDREAASAQSES